MILHLGNSFSGLLAWIILWKIAQNAAGKICFGQKSWSNLNPNPDKSFDASYPCQLQAGRLPSRNHSIMWLEPAIEGTCLPVMGHTQFFTHQFNWMKRLPLPLTFSARIARNYRSWVLQKGNRSKLPLWSLGGSYLRGIFDKIQLVERALVADWRIGRVGCMAKANWGLDFQRLSDRGGCCQKKTGQGIDSWEKMWS